MDTKEQPQTKVPVEPDGRPRLFLSHAGEDKESAARPLADALETRGVTVWYDEYILSLGDSLTAVIDRGLRECTHGVVILSHSFFKKAWPLRELQGLVAREMHEGRKVILPVRHQISVEDVIRYSPPLGDKLSVSISDGIERVVDEILRALEVPSAQVARRSSRRLGTVAAVAAPIVLVAGAVGTAALRADAESPDHHAGKSAPIVPTAEPKSPVPPRLRAEPTETPQASAPVVSSQNPGASVGQSRGASALSLPWKQVHKGPRHVDPLTNPAASHPPDPRHSTDSHRASETGSAEDSSVWNEAQKLSSTHEAAARREDGRILQEAYQRLVGAHSNLSKTLPDFQPSRGAGGTPDLKLRRTEGVWAAPRIGFYAPVIFTKYEIRLSEGEIIFSDMDAGPPFYKTSIGSPNYGEDFVAAVRRSMEPQIRAELDRK